MARRLDRRAAWAALSSPTTGEVPRFDPSTLDDLPSPARRLLGRALPPGTPLDDSVVLQMRGHICIGRWWPFHGDEVLRAGHGFMWRPVVGGRVLRITGADVLWSGRAEVDFRLHGLVPVARSHGPDVDRSARGRLAAETVAWVPQALTPQRGARWAELDGDAAAVTLDVAGEPIEVQVDVDADGALRSVCLQRWRGDADPAQLEAFGGCLEREHVTASGVRMAGRGEIGWGWGTPDWDDGRMFRFEITTARHGGASGTGP